MKIVNRGKKPCITIGEQPLLWVEGLTLYNRKGDMLPQRFTKAKECCFDTKGEGSNAQLELKQQGCTVTLRLTAQLESSKPLFARSNNFDGSHSATLALGLAELTQSVAVYQHKDWWLRPAFCQQAVDLPNRTQLLLFPAQGGYCALVAVADRDCRADFFGKSGLTLTLSSNTHTLNRLEELCLAVSWGDDPYRCCKEACRMAMEESGKAYALKAQKALPQMLEYLGWCSWDAFYHKVDEKGLLEKMEELHQKEIPARWVLIDDGWLDADYKNQKLRGLDADKKKFPGGLRQTTRLLKERYGIQQVGVWHAIMGYWNGVEAASPAHNALTEHLRTLEDGRVIPKPSAGDAFAFWNSWHDFLHRNGIDFVKVDGQSAISNYNWDRLSYGAASKASHTALEASASVNFNGNLINCMGMAPEDIWNRPNASVSRNSDDFVPFTPNGFREHAIQNAYNTLLHGQFYYGDWDMFWSDHEESVVSSMLRAVSGGPVYISDKVGKSNPATIRPLILEDGRLLRCQELGLPTMDCLFTDPVATGKALKIFNSWQDVRLLAAFNIGELGTAVEATVSSSDLPGLPESLWLYDYNAGSLHSLEGGASYTVTLPAASSNIFVLLPKTEQPAILGNTEKYLAPATVERVVQGHNSCQIFLRESGDCAVAFAENGLRAFSGDKELSCCPTDGLYRFRQEEICDLTLRLEWEEATC